VVVVGALALAGVIFAVTRDDSSGERNSDIVTTDATAPAETAPPESVPAETVPAETVPAETVPAETVPAETVPAETAPPETAPPVAASDGGNGDSGFTTINGLLAWTSFGEEPLDEAAQQSEIDRLIAERTVDAVAHPTAVSTICAGVPVDVQLDFTITWQYLGETVQSDEQSATPPGVGSCIDNGGEPLGAGSYQVFTANADQTEIGNATTFVIGANSVAQSFVNNTDDDICEIGIAPVDTSYYEFFVSEQGAVGPGEFIIVDIASVEQDLLARRCDGSDIGAFTFVPNAGTDQGLAP